MIHPMVRRSGFGPRLPSRTSPQSVLEASPHRMLATADLSAAPAHDAQAPWLETTYALQTFREFQQARRAARELVDAHRAATGGTLSRRDALAEVGAPDVDGRDIYHGQLQARFSAAIDAEIGYRERLVWFWGNHFAVSAGGGVRRLRPGLLEAEAIRPHVDGSFADMLLAVSTHWAMLGYLNGNASIGPMSRVGLRRERGLNENWAREILELHTVGVGGGYTQPDVVALAEILTGWRYYQMRSDDRGQFLFQAGRHEPGPKTLLGKTYPEDGFEQGVAALQDLARHPSTARHLATKLARHFIADDPPERLVQELAAVFLETGGDLAAVSQALIESPEAQEASPAKLRLPQEFLVAMLRATGVELEPRLIDRMCRIMGQPVWQPPGPDGFPDTVDYWLSPEGMKRRLDVAMAVAERVDPTLEPIDVLEVVIGDIASDDTRWAVARAESRQQAFALLFMSPEFQWR